MPNHCFISYETLATVNIGILLCILLEIKQYYDTSLGDKIY